jgi:NTE family protein
MSSRLRGRGKRGPGPKGLPSIVLAAWLCSIAGPVAAGEPSAAREAAAAQESTRTSSAPQATAPVFPARPRIGLALSGGGARGAAHIGVLRVLEEHRIPIDYIAGTSMGAIVGGLYASGLSPDELETMITHIDWTDAFSDFIPRAQRSYRRKRDDDLFLVKSKPGVSRRGLLFPPGLLDGQKIDLLLKRYTLPVSEIRDFDKLGIPFHAVATDLATGDPVVLDHGDLAMALRASMSIPIVFAPREIDGRLLVDGGVGRNLPIDVVRRMGADVVIAVDISTPLRKRDELRSVIAVTDQIMGIMTRRDTDLQIDSMRAGDVLIRPDLGDITTASFDRAFEAVPIGFEAAADASDTLARLAVPPEEYRAHEAALEAERRAAGRRPPGSAPPVIDELRIVNGSRLATGVITERLHIVIGEPLDVERLERDLDQIFGLELFESVYYDLTEESGRTVLTVTLRARSWGPNYLQFGVAVFEDYEGPNFNLAAAYTRTAINTLNGEWRLGVQVGQEPAAFTEFYQPLRRSLRPFVSFKASVVDRADNVFDADGHKIEELGVRSWGGEVAAGRELGTFGEIRAGILRGAGRISTQVGPPGTPKVHFNTGEAFAQFSIDELDDAYFPHSGGDLRIRYTSGLEDLGSDIDYEQGIVEGSIAASLGRWTGLLEETFGTTRRSNAPYQSLFRLGGFTRLSGLEQDELVGQHAALAAAVVYRKIADLTMATLYAGASVEYGNVFQTREEMTLDNGRVAGSVFLGLDTPIGPIYLAYGVAERNRGNYYFCLGKRR